MTPLARRKLQLRMKRAFKLTVSARKTHQRAIVAHKKLVKRLRAA